MGIDFLSSFLLMADNGLQQAFNVLVHGIIMFVKCLEAPREICAKLKRRIIPLERRVSEMKLVVVII